MLLDEGCWEAQVTETGDPAKSFIENAIIANGGARPLYLHADNATAILESDCTPRSPSTTAPDGKSAGAAR